MLERLFLSPSPFSLPSSSRTTLTIPRETEESQGMGRILRLSAHLTRKPQEPRRGAATQDTVSFAKDLLVQRITRTHTDTLHFQERRRERERGKRLRSPECNRDFSCNRYRKITPGPPAGPSLWGQRAACGMRTSPAGKPGTGQLPVARRWVTSGKFPRHPCSSLTWGHKCLWVFKYYEQRKGFVPERGGAKGGVFQLLFPPIPELIKYFAFCLCNKVFSKVGKCFPYLLSNLQWCKTGLIRIVIYTALYLLRHFTNIR